MKRIGSALDTSRFMMRPWHGQKGQSEEKERERDDGRQFERGNCNGGN